MDITGKYKFEITKDINCYVIYCEHNGNDYCTTAKTEEEAFEMMADLFMTIKEIKISRWSRFWHKLLRLK